MIPSAARAVITLILAGWCAVLPVFAQLCPCTVAGPVNSATAEIDSPQESLGAVKKSCCGHCSTKPVSTSAELGSEPEDNEPAPCRCDEVSRFELFLAEVSNTDRSVSDAVQPLLDVVVWGPPTEATGVLFERAPPPVISHQRKRACLGVWRL